MLMRLALRAATVIEKWGLFLYPKGDDEDVAAFDAWLEGGGLFPPDPFVSRFLFLGLERLTHLLSRNCPGGAQMSQAVQDAADLYVRCDEPEGNWEEWREKIRATRRPTPGGLSLTELQHATSWYHMEMYHLRQLARLRWTDWNRRMLAEVLGFAIGEASQTLRGWMNAEDIIDVTMLHEHSMAFRKRLERPAREGKLTRGRDYRERRDRETGLEYNTDSAKVKNIIDKALKDWPQKA